ncbi:MAG: hypothetical protein NWF08_01620 [Candidatus Bathyarchaeota archaeon]|nr:hypothetical protein [Candidatus Bathyarchaeota archaeon]
MKKIFRNFTILIILTSLIFPTIFYSHEVKAWKGEVDQFVICESVDVLVDPVQPKNVRSVFLSTEKAAFAFLRMENIEGPLTLSIEWVDPNGEVYNSTKFTPITNQTEYTIKISYLDFSLVMDKLGEWEVNAYANDELISSTSFKLLESAPLLTVVNVSLNPEAGMPFYLGSTLTITYALENVGGEIARQVRMTMEDLDPSDGIIVSPSDTKDLEPAESDDWTIELVGEKPGNYTGKMTLYIGDERIKVWDWTIIVSLPELELVDIVMFSKGGKQRPKAGDFVTITYVIRNVGKLDAKQIGFDVKLPEDLELIHITPTKDIGVNQTSNFIVELLTKKEGDYTVEVALYSYDYKISEEKRVIQVSPASTEDTWMLLILGSIIVLVMIVAIILIKRRLSKSKDSRKLKR